ncbi:hypothetical protein ACVWXP_001730 [Bradyrhizobium sp. USDA 4463]
MYFSAQVLIFRGYGCSFREQLFCLFIRHNDLPVQR